MSLSQLIKAQQIAKMAHAGQVDKANVDYIKHPETVASFVNTYEEKAVAYLYDVLEDTSVTLLDLETFGVSKRIRDAVDILTRKKGQDYQSYLEIVKTNELARVVKLADLRHNSDLTRLPKITEKDLKRNEKYNAILKGEKSSKHKKAEKLKLDGQDIEIIDEFTFYDLLEN